ncbi:LCP family protein [Microbacterium sp. NPDC056234]|uniref:LCP family glycopolymer transferase n=1 Tax=Microbacterium sp. NPDC056234 TaxID=3345757 RepID=UPI0035DE3AD7
MTIAAPRAGFGARPIIETRPMRNPDLNDSGFMARRGWWLVALNVLVPGSAQVLAGNRRLGRFALGATLFGWLFAIVAVGLALFARPTFLWLTVGAGWVSTILLTIVQVVLVGYLVLWIVLAIDTLRLVRLVRVSTVSRFGIPVAMLVILGLVGAGTGYAATVVGSSRDTLGSIFTQSGPSLPPSDGYYNILLLGADSGEGRDSMRYDSISVVSVNADTGAVTITGIPRDMPGFPFAEGPMHDKYPNGHESHNDSTCGWGSGINQLRTEVEVCNDGAELYPDAQANGSEPGIEATKDAAEGILGVEIPYYVFIDMNGFANLIDALGGVQITVDKRLPKGGGPSYTGEPAEDWAIGWIEPGEQMMNGDTAQWYARSRYTTNDWDRMKRQRQLQEAILAQFTPQTVLTRFNEIAAAGTALVKTDLPQDKLPEFFDLVVKAKAQAVTSIELTPENGIDDQDPDYEYIRQVIQDTLHPPTATPDPSS